MTRINETSYIGKTGIPTPPPVGEPGPKIAMIGDLVMISALTQIQTALGADYQSMALGASDERSDQIQTIEGGGAYKALPDTKTLGATVPDIGIVMLGAMDQRTPPNQGKAWTMGKLVMRWTELSAMNPSLHKIAMTISEHDIRGVPTRAVALNALIRTTYEYVIDWAAATNAHPEYLEVDGITPTAAGQVALKDLVLEQVAAVSEELPPPPPPPTGWPDETNTGVPTGVTLRTYTGPTIIDVPGTVIDSKIINGGLYIGADNVTISRCVLTSQGQDRFDGVNIIQVGNGYDDPPVHNVTIVDCELKRPDGATGGLQYAVLDWGYDTKVLRCNIHNVQSGIHTSRHGLRVEDCYIWDMKNISGSDHLDGIISNGGVYDVHILHNNIEMNDVQTSPICVFPESYCSGNESFDGVHYNCSVPYTPAPNHDWVIDGNLLNGGGSEMYLCYTPGSGGTPNTQKYELPNYNMTITNNHFGRKFFQTGGANGPLDGTNFNDGTNIVFTGNVWDDTGLPVV